MVAHGLPRREAARQHPPLATRLVGVKNGVYNGALVVFWHRPPLVRRLEIGLDKPPFFLRNVTIVPVFNKLPLIKKVIL
jgi:predicted ABC-type sugar transport system permease subunit